MGKNIMDCKVAGTTFEGRQRIIGMLSKRDDVSIRFERDMDNAYDPNAIAVFADYGAGRNAQIGFVPKDTAAILAPQMDDGHHVDVKRCNFVGGDGFNYGVRLIIEVV